MMSQRRSARLCLLLSAAVLLCACAESDVYEDFVKKTARGADGRYGFDLPMTDSLAMYDIEFYMRLDCTDREHRFVGDFPLDIMLVSPSGLHFSEKVYASSLNCTESSYYSKVYTIPYRKGCVPVECGKWQMSVLLPEELPGVTGIGVKLQRYSDNDGKR